MRKLIPSLFTAFILAVPIPSCVPVAITGAAAITVVGCATTLDPAGVYQGDELLYKAEGAVVDIADACDRITGFAERNPTVVNQNDALSRFVARVEAELDGEPNPDEVLTSLTTAIEAYRSLKSAGNQVDLEDKLAAARLFLTEAQRLLPEVINDPS